MRIFLRNSLILIAMVLTIGCTNATCSNRPLKFAHITDDHLSFTHADTPHKMTGHSAALLQDAIDQLNKEGNIKFLMFTGDSVDSPSEDDAKIFISMANRLKSPWYLAFGNHEIAVWGNLSKKRYLELLNEKNKNYHFQQSYYSFRPQKGYKVIALDAVDNSHVTARGYMPKEELNWLDNEISIAPNDVILMFMHHPLVEPFESAGHRISNTDEFYAVLNKHKNPMAIISGHYHASKITQRGNILHVSSPALVTYPNAFRVITVRNEKNRAVFTFKWKETNLKDVQLKAKVRNLGAPRYAGNKCDKVGDYIIYAKD